MLHTLGRPLEIREDLLPEVYFISTCETACKREINLPPLSTSGTLPVARDGNWMKSGHGNSLE